MKCKMFFIIIALTLGAHCTYASKNPSIMPGKITLTNAASEDIDVYFYATNSDRINKKYCSTFIQTIPAGDTVSIAPKCRVNIIEIHHTPEEEFEQTTKEFISNDMQKNEIFFVYQGPNRIVPVNSPLLKAHKG